MKPKLILCLIVVVIGSLFGCSTTPPVTETKVFDYSNGDSPVTDGLVLTGLGKSFSILAAADSWPALVQKIKPTFAWNGCDMMWIGSNKHGKLQFVLDEAYVYQPTNQSRQWILVKDERTQENYESRQNEDWWRQFSILISIRNLRAIAGLQDSKPLPND
jgi:hypothetical protein